MNSEQSPFEKPRPLEYPQHFRAGMGTENVAPFLRSMVQLTRPNRILEIGAGYTTPWRADEENVCTPFSTLFF